MRKQKAAGFYSNGSRSFILFLQCVFHTPFAVIIILRWLFCQVQFETEMCQKCEFLTVPYFLLIFSMIASIQNALLLLYPCAAAA